MNKYHSKSKFECNIDSQLDIILKNHINIICLYNNTNDIIIKTLTIISRRSILYDK